MDLLEKVKQHKLVILIALGILAGIFIFWQKSSSVNNDSVFNQASPNDHPTLETKPIKKSDNKGKNSSKNSEIVVDLTGAVKKEGVYSLKADARLNDLINRAGGTLKNANLKAINRAQILNDQDKIYVPFKGEVVDELPSATANGSPTSGKGNDSNSGDSKLININTATSAELMELNGIGPKKAEQIISYREENGGFKTTADLKNVSGIGDKTFAILEDQITV